MKSRILLFVLALSLVLSVLVTACQQATPASTDSAAGETVSNESTAPAEQKETKVEESQEKKGGLDVTEESPLAVNAEKKTVTVLAKVNGKYFKTGTRHGLVYKGGKFGDKAVFSAWVSPKDFYEALISIGAVPSENMKIDTAQENSVKGDLFKVEILTADEKVIDINEAIKDSKGNPIEIRFGGNLDAAKEYETGCLACLDSCPVGITSNATYKYGAVEESKEVEFFGNEEVLPADGTFVAVRFTLQPGTALKD